MNSHLRECPICGSRKIFPTKKDLEFVRQNKKIRIPQVTCEVCPDCGEIITDYEANQYIDSVVFGQEYRRAS
ncbi:MAG: YgiT-type zinc finger protein [Deltaproteobacteria bacterium]|nr:YgiT-type zinc finger protein [Deltaproteobacteria bacterium]